jgi:hypothetical protein
MNDYLVDTKYASLLLIEAINKGQIELKRIGVSIAQLKYLVDIAVSFCLNQN